MAAIDDNGDSIIVWIQSNGTYWRVLKSEYRNGIWTHPVDENDGISPNISTVEAHPKVAMNSNGTAIIAWTQYAPLSLDMHILASMYRNGSWTHPVDLSESLNPIASNFGSFDISLNDNDEAIVAWEQRSNPSDYSIYKSEYSNNSWSNPIDINDYISPTSGSAGGGVDASINSNGNAIITWIQSSPGGVAVFISERSVEGVWTHPSSENDNIFEFQANLFYPIVSLSDNGDTLVTWMAYDPVADFAKIMKSEKRLSLWTHPQDINDFISISGSNAGKAYSAINPEGESIIVWAQNDLTSNHIYTSEYR